MTRNNEFVSSNDIMGWIFLLNCKDRQGKECNRCIFTWIYKTDSDRNLISASSRPKKYGGRGPNICTSVIACMWALLGRIIQCSGETKWKSLYTKVTWSRISNPSPKVWPAKTRINQFFFAIPNTREVSHHVGERRINKFGKRWKRFGNSVQLSWNSSQKYANAFGGR